MTPRTRRESFAIHYLAFGRRALRRRSEPQPLRRRLRFEPLEDRRLLSITVNTLVDEADGSVVDGDISLRDAIALAPAGETINFAPALTSGGPAAINLALGELAIKRKLSIAGPGAHLLTIDAQGNSRLFNIDDGTVARVRSGETKLYAVWPGEWSSDLFLVDDIDEFEKGRGPRPERLGGRDHLRVGRRARSDLCPGSARKSSRGLVDRALLVGTGFSPD